MADQDNKIKAAHENLSSKELLEQSRALREKRAALKLEMEQTRKACDDFLHPEKNDNEESRNQPG